MMSINELIMNYVFSPSESNRDKVIQFQEYKEDKHLLLLNEIYSNNNVYERTQIYNKYKEKEGILKPFRL